MLPSPYWRDSLSEEKRKQCLVKTLVQTFEIQTESYREGKRKLGEGELEKEGERGREREFPHANSVFWPV